MRGDGGKQTAEPPRVYTNHYTHVVFDDDDGAASTSGPASAEPSARSAAKEDDGRDVTAERKPERNVARTREGERTAA